MRIPTVIIDKKDELFNCNFVKTILMIIVVLYHCILFWTGSWFTVQKPILSSKFLAILSEWLNTFHIYGFTLVSGYLFFYLKYEKGSYTQFISFIKNKIKRLLIPYIFISIFWVIPISCLFFDYSPVNVIKNYLIGLSPSQLWFLLMLFGVFVIFYPLSNFFKENNIGGTALAFIFYCVGFVGQATFPNVFQIFRTCTYIVFFLLGFKIRQYGSQQLRKIPSVVWIFVDVLIFVLMQNLSNYDGIIFTLLGQGVRFLLHIIGALMSFVVLQKLADILKWKDSKLFIILSKNSMSVYLLHQQIIYILIFLLNGVVNPYINASVNFIGSMIISLLISTFMRKFKWTRTLMGEK